MGLRLYYQHHMQGFITTFSPPQDRKRLKFRNRTIQTSAMFPLIPANFHFHFRNAFE